MLQVVFSKHALVLGWRDGLGFSEAIQPVNASRRATFNDTEKKPEMTRAHFATELELVHQNVIAMGELTLKASRTA